ncbi:hypothetical protein WMY93_012152 [Mugilogobius chulae]|uniref:Tensin 2b n=1 Tax=Mugilogobius chulae TaxID=88201 RepID=A0AAW0P7Y5_9GOBI
MITTRSRAAAPPRREEPVEVARASVFGWLLDASPGRYFGQVPLGGDLEEDPGHAGGTMFLDWPGNASGFPQKSWLKCLSSSSGRHSFTERSFRRQVCDVCKKNISRAGNVCTDCKVSVHKSCQSKVSSSCSSALEQLGSSSRSSSLKKRGSLPRSRSVERVMEQNYDFDLTYITERIISVFFPELDEPQYHHNIQEVALMLKNKHRDKFMLLNLSEKRHDITRLNPKVQDFGWPDLHAPPLDRICSVCKAMESWLSQDPLNVVVLHCKGNKGKTGVIVAAYMHYSKISAGAEQALTTLAMRKFCEDKVSSSLQPSQNRYIYYFGGLLSGSIQMNSSPLFLQQILIPSLPNFQPEGGFFPFVKIYQSLQLVHTSGLYDPQNSRARKLSVSLDTPLLLKGDIMVKCFHRRSSSEREEVFRVQFHSCAVHGAQLWFRKNDLDHACNDDRFPLDATVEFLFSNGPEKIKGRECRKNDSCVKVKSDVSDPVLRWDSYEDFNLHHEDSIENICHTRGPLDGSLYAQVRKRRGPGSAPKPSSTNGNLRNGPTVRSPPSKPRPLPSIPPEEPTSPVKTTEEKHRETAILDDSESRKEHQCCGQNVPREKEPCLVDSHCHNRCNCVKNKSPKSQTLPALVSKSTSPPPPPQFSSSQLELYHRHSTFPHQDLQIQRPPLTINQPCVYQKCFQYQQFDRNASSSPRLCSGSDFQLYFPSQSPSTHLSQPALTSGPYRELFIGPQTHQLCPCPDCASRATVRAFHGSHTDQSDGSHWSHGSRQRELWESPWQREPDFWQYQKSPVQAFHSCPATVSPSPALDQRRFPFGAPGPSPAFPSPHPQSEVREAGRSESHGHTQLEPSVSCPVPVSIAESPVSRGYVSGSNSPLSVSTPSPGRASLPQEQASSAHKQTSSTHTQTSSTRHLQSSAHQHLSAVQQQTSSTSHKTSSTQQQTSPTLHHPGSSQQLHTDPLTAFPKHLVPLLLQQDCVYVFFSVVQTTSGIITVYTRSRDKYDPVVTPDSSAAQSPDAKLCITPLDKPSPSDSVSPVDPGPVNLPVSSPVQVQLNGSAFVSMNTSPSPTSSLSSPEPLTPDLPEPKPPSPVPDGYNTPTFPLASYYYPLLNVPHVPYTGYTAVTIPSQPPLPEKKRPALHPGINNGHGSVHRVSSAPVPSPSLLSLGSAEQRRGSAQVEGDIRVNAKFVQDSSKFWYKPGISRDQAIAVLKDKEPGSFLIRDSNSFQGAYGLALKVETAPPNANLTTNKAGDPLEQLVRHFLIETGPRGVKIKGCQNEAYFGSLSALVFQHSITPVSLPCALRIPEKDLVGELQEIQSVSSTSTAATLLRQGAACNVLYLNSVETESLTGPEAVSKATKVTLSLVPRPVATVVHFKVSVQGITLTDSKRRIFFRRHYPINTVTFSSLDPQDKRWTNSESTSCKMFGFVARRTGGSSAGNMCHLFAEVDPEQPAVAIVNFINKVMLAPHLRR